MAGDHLHTPEAIARRLLAGPGVSYLRDWVYGGIDGAVTTFAVVAGVEGALLPSGVIVVLGLANLVGDGLSMAAGNYSGTRTELHERAHYEAMENRHIERHPEGEREEVRQIFRRKGFDGAALETIVATITDDRQRWVTTMLVEEHGLSLEPRVPVRSASATFAAFMLCGSVPLLPYLLSAPLAFATSSALTACVFFGIGSLRARWSVDPWWRLGLGTLTIGALAAGAAWGIGWALADAVVR